MAPSQSPSLGLVGPVCDIWERRLLDCFHGHGLGRRPGGDGLGGEPRLGLCPHCLLRAGGGSSSAIAPSTAGSGTFATSEKSTASGTLTALSSSPSVSVLVPDGTGTASVSPTSVTESPVPTTLTFTFVAPASGINDGALAIAVPAGWTAPTTASSSAGYTTASSGTVSVSGQLITVSNLIMSANSQLTVTYGAGGGASSVLPQARRARPRS